MDDNIKKNDYVLFKFDYNIQTGDFSIKFLIPLRKLINQILHLIN